MIETLKTGLARFKEGFLKGGDIFSLMSDWSTAVDSSVKALFEANLPAEARVAVFALGGYGRREMSPYSDVDLMFLYEGDIKAVQKTVDGILYPLWDSKFEAGGATRTLKDCSSMLEGEIRAQTAMLDARLIAGDKELAERFLKLIEKKLNCRFWKRKFVRAKYFEQETRFKKFGDSVYMLEPHVKESEGGLREHQTACWIAKVLGIPDPPNPPEGGLEFISRLRARLHFIVGRREDRLTFENQKALASQFNKTPEALMSEYYRATSTIHKSSKSVTNNAAPFFKRLVSRWREERVRKIIGEEPSWQRLTANRDIIYQALLFLHETGNLLKLVPSFKDIYFRTQYGAYHVYTVDVHSIFAVKKLLELEKDDRHKVISSVYKKIKDKNLLLLATLLHDIGKVSDKEGSHTHVGGEIASKEAMRLGYGSDDADKVAFLVESHLIMPRIAYSRDLADPILIENFASSIGSVELLDMLFVLTYADIASIGPNVWNVWKEKLLNDLYLSARRSLTGFKAHHLKKEIELLKKTAVQTDDGHTKIWFSSMPERYFMANDIDAIMGHIEMFRSFTTQEVLASHRASATHSEFLVMTKDAPGIFLKIAGIMTANNVNIMEAELNTGKNGIVFDILRVQSEIGGPVQEPLAMRIVKGLEDVFSGRKDVAELVKKRGIAIKRRGIDIEPKVLIDNEVSAYYTVLDIFSPDRIGLLYDLARELFKEGCSIGVAKILTNVDQAKDSFYIRSFNGEKIVSKERLEEIKKALLGVL